MRKTLQVTFSWKLIHREHSNAVTCFSGKVSYIVQSFFIGTHLSETIELFCIIQDFWSCHLMVPVRKAEPSIVREVQTPGK